MDGHRIHAGVSFHAESHDTGMLIRRMLCYGNCSSDDQRALLCKFCFQPPAEALQSVDVWGAVVDSLSAVEVLALTIAAALRTLMAHIEGKGACCDQSNVLC